MQQRYRAKWIVPIEGLPQENGVLVVEQGRIADIRKSHGLWPACDLGDVVILPGLVNAHVHLDLPGSLLASARAGGFVSWLRAVIAYRRASSQQQTESVIRQGIAESLRYGVTCLGDISADGTSARLLAAVGMKSLVFQEVLGLTRERTRETARAARWRLQNCTWNDALRGALGPHAPYSTARVLYRWAGAFAARHAIPLATHVAETLEELQLLRSRTGPLRELLEELGIWRPQALCRTIPEVLQCMSTAPRVIAVHANYCDEKTLAAAVQLFAHRPGGIVFALERTPLSGTSLTLWDFIEAQASGSLWGQTVALRVPTSTSWAKCVSCTKPARRSILESF